MAFFVDKPEDLFYKSEDYYLRKYLEISKQDGLDLLTSVRFAFLSPSYAAAVRRAISLNCSNDENESDQVVEQIVNLSLSELSRKIISLQLDVRDARQRDKLLTSHPLGCWAFLHDKDYGLPLDQLPSLTLLCPRRSYCFSLSVSGESHLGANAGIFFIWLDPKHPISNNKTIIESSSSSKKKEDNKMERQEEEEEEDNDNDNDEEETISGNSASSCASSATTTTTTLSSTSTSLSISPVVTLTQSFVSPTTIHAPKSRVHRLPAKYVNNIRNFTTAYSLPSSNSLVNTPLVFNGLQCALAVVEASCDDRFNVLLPSSFEIKKQTGERVNTLVTPLLSLTSSSVPFTSSSSLCTSSKKTLLNQQKELPNVTISQNLSQNTSTSKTKSLWTVYEEFAGGEEEAMALYTLLGQDVSQLQFNLQPIIRWINCCDIARLCILWLLGGGTAYMDTDMMCPSDLYSSSLSTSSSSFSSSSSSSSSTTTPSLSTMSRLLPPSLVSRTPFNKQLNPLREYTVTETLVKTEPDFPTLFLAQDADGVIQNNFLALADGFISSDNQVQTQSKSKTALHHPLLTLLLQAIVASALEESHVIHATGPALVTAVFHAFRKTIIPSSPSTITTISAHNSQRDNITIIKNDEKSIPFSSLPRVSEDSSSFIQFKSLLLPQYDTAVSTSSSSNLQSTRHTTLGDTVWVFPPSCFFTTHWRDEPVHLTVPPPLSPALSPALSSSPLPSLSRIQSLPQKIPSSLRSASIPLPPANFGFFGPALPDPFKIGHGSNALTPRSLQRSLGREGNLRGRKEQQQKQQQQQLSKMISIQSGTISVNNSVTALLLNQNQSITQTQTELLSQQKYTPSSSLSITLSDPITLFEEIDQDTMDYEYSKENKKTTYNSFKEDIVPSFHHCQETTDMEKKEKDTRTIEQTNYPMQHVDHPPIGQIQGRGEMPPALHGFGPMQSSSLPFVWTLPDSTSVSNSLQLDNGTNRQENNNYNDDRGNKNDHNPVFGLHCWDCTWGKDDHSKMHSTSPEKHPYASAFSLSKSPNNTTSNSSYTRATYYGAAATGYNLYSLLFPSNSMSSTELLKTQSKEKQNALDRSNLQIENKEKRNKNSHLIHDDDSIIDARGVQRDNTISSNTFQDIFGVSFLARRVLSRLADSGLPALPQPWAIKLWLSGEEAGDLQGATHTELVKTLSTIVSHIEEEEDKEQKIG